MISDRYKQPQIPIHYILLVFKHHASTLSFSLSFWIYVKSNTYNFNQFNGMNYLWASLLGLTGSGGGAGANMALWWQCTGGAYL